MEKVIELLMQINEKLANQREDIFYTRDEAQEHYGLSKREVDKIYNTLLRDKVVNIGKYTRLAKVHIDKLFTDGVKMKHI